jgi:hypothetical protein
MVKELGPAIDALVGMPSAAPLEVPDVLAPADKETSGRTALPLPPPPAALLNLTTDECLSVPRLLKSPAEIASLPLGPRSAFILAQIDGKHNLEEILDICAMTPSEAVEILRELVTLGVIELD